MKSIKCILPTLITILFLAKGFAQDFQGEATYFSKTSFDLDLDGRQLSEEQNQRIRRRVKNSSERTYVLTFDKTSSLYIQEEKLDAPTNGGQGRGRGVRFAFGGFGAGGKYYKNVQEKRYLSQSEMFGKQFLIKDSLAQWEWELGSETKKIGNYTCYKATAIIEPDSTTFERLRRMARGPRTRQGGERDSTRSNTVLSRIEEPRERVVTVWYTPEIPISQGPGDYWGLPGLILEVNDGRTTILCTKIVLNAEDAEEIKIPSKGKEVSQAEYDKILGEKMDEMSERFRAGNRRGGGNGIRIITN
ncbi:GLPGLI family protein [Flagellimonas onchidii]|uniref:GLPGLI family protein n=1 Tax=Flagellimonas onchidii TaxID=2562684 RepID=UPI0010A5E982|nr:GLPGLI family protein [Allomuricauda onchidii]